MMVGMQWLLHRAHAAEPYIQLIKLPFKTAPPHMTLWRGPHCLQC